MPADGNQKMTFAYDARNRCVHRQTYTRITGNWSLITDYFLIYDNWNLIEEWTTGGAQIAHYVHGPRIDEILVKVSTTNAVYFHHDALGNVTHLTGTNGTVVERYTYDVFGTVTIKDGSGNALGGTAYANRFLFTGREWLAELSLYDYRNRVYSPDLGRFLQTDPIQFDARDVNIYRYVGNDPVDLIDPDGRTACWVSNANGWVTANISCGSTGKYKLPPPGPFKPPIPITPPVKKTWWKKLWKGFVVPLTAINCVPCSAGVSLIEVQCIGWQGMGYSDFNSCVCSFYQSSWLLQKTCDNCVTGPTLGFGPNMSQLLGCGP